MCDTRHKAAVAIPRAAQQLIPGWPCGKKNKYPGKCISAWPSVFVIQNRQAVKRNIAAPFALQLRQFTDEFKPDFLMALSTGREYLSSKQRYFVRQTMLRMSHSVDSAFRDGFRALVK
jgi:hypothetical protein